MQNYKRSEAKIPFGLHTPFMINKKLRRIGLINRTRGCIHRAFVSRVNTNETLVFLNTWFSHPKNLVFCALTKAIHKDLEENQVFQVRGFFNLVFVWF
jgi:hypothetical protein